MFKGVKKFLRYNDDLIEDERKQLILDKQEAFREALDDRSLVRSQVQEMADDLSDTCKKSVKDYNPSAMRENIEVLFVAVVIAMGIRAYFIQQFKIPTGSMQPTLNGIIAYPDKSVNSDSEYNAPDGYEKPGVIKQIADKIWYGRSHVDWVAEEDDVLLLDRDHFYDRNLFIFFPRTYLKTKNGKTYSAPGTISRVAALLNEDVVKFPTYQKVAEIKKGQVIAKGFVDTGDQLVVNKFIYNWRAPKRGEVFVFATNGIPVIQRRLDDPRQGSQHYIKRLVGVPGDSISVEPPLLKVNGEVAKEPGMQKVMSKEGYYAPGYTLNGRYGKITLADKEYWAMGDNSDNSSDSREWGRVPEVDIVGRGAFVYYPFGHHFGKVK